MTAKYTFDTNIIKGYRIEDLPERFYLSTVVLSELITSAADQTELNAYLETWRRHEKEGTLLTPTTADWLMASKTLCWLAWDRKKKAGGKSPKRPPAAKQELAMDALLAACARSEGVTVVTNDTDFDAIRYYMKTLKLRSLKSGADVLKL